MKAGLCIMTITTTPFRTYFFVAEQIWKTIKKNGGAVISSTFEKYCYAQCIYALKGKYVENGILSGTFDGKLLGAGGGGFHVF